MIKLVTFMKTYWVNQKRERQNLTDLFRLQKYLLNLPQSGTRQNIRAATMIELTISGSYIL